MIIYHITKGSRIILFIQFFSASRCIPQRDPSYKTLCFFLTFRRIFEALLFTDISSNENIYK